MIADRVDRLDVSGIRRVFDLAKKLENPINFSIGQPDFPVPDAIKEASIKAISENTNSYTPTQGMAPLVEALCADSNARSLHYEDLIVTSGVSGGLFLAFSALLNPGDEVLITDPYFLMYKQLALFLDASPRYIPTYPHFKCTAAAIEPYLSEKSRLLVLNMPGNPTGMSLSDTELKDLVELLDRYPKLTVISDEIYRIFSYDHPFTSLAQLRDNVITLDGFSKSHAVTGWRVGWASGPKKIIQQMAKLQQFTFVCAPSCAQAACITALSTPMDNAVSCYKEKRDLIFNALSDAYEVPKPDGTFYIFPKIPDRYSSSQEFIEKALDNNLLIIPGNVFSQQDTHFRISFATSNEKLREGAAILNDMV